MRLTRIFYQHGIDRRSCYVVELLPIRDTNLMSWVFMLDPVGPIHAPTDFSIATCLFATRAVDRDWEIEIDLPRPVRFDAPLEGKRGLIARMHRYVEDVVTSADRLKKVRPIIRPRAGYNEFIAEAWQESLRQLRGPGRPKRHRRRAA